VLGTSEPQEGRYTTISRINYLGERPRRGTPQTPLRDTLVEEKKSCARTMHNKNFAFGYEHVPLPMVSEARAAQSRAMDVRWGRSPTPTLAPMSGTPSPAPGHPHLASQPEVEMTPKENAERMRESSVFKSAVIPPTLDSTQRASYERWDASQRASGVSSSLKEMHHATHFTLGSEPSSKWKSDYGGNFRGKSGVKAHLSDANQACSANIGDSTVDVRDSLRSLKQVDFVSHAWKRPVAPAVSCHTHSAVFGYRDEKPDSTQRVSYTPLHYVGERPHDSAEAAARAAQLRRFTAN
jgi:hypothetical protein